jgi:hypothetical protein
MMAHTSTLVQERLHGERYIIRRQTTGALIDAYKKEHFLCDSQRKANEEKN